MNHDIRHCNGENCPVRKTCHRYMAHVDLTEPAKVNEPISGFQSYFNASTCISEDLKMYWGENYQINC
jgi:hypothetical protein